MPKTILLADDSVTIQKVVELTFMEEDIEVVTVGTGDEALRRLPETRPDLVIADVHMPGPDGFEVCREVKTSTPEVPVLLLVGTFEPFNPEDVDACGAEGYLKKPFDSQELIRKVDELLAGAPESATETREASAEETFHLASALEPPALAPPTGEEPAAAPDDTTEVALEAEDEVPLEPAPAAEPEPEEEAPAAGTGPGGLSDEDIDRLARRVAEILGEAGVREVAWEVVPDLAEVAIRERLRELEKQAD